jgi:pyruvate/2-oxoglutarate dehydrogenase complex dihydrolipoamide acyltransferase (E2) component|tara:strand:+ start:41 stop:262 length:222 start_codon:yes stop_codon:yes gene_type:complete
MQSLAYEMEAAVVIEWMVSVGDQVAKGDPILIVETEKAEVEMEALDEGVLVEVVRGPGDEVPVGGVLGYLEPG